MQVKSLVSRDEGAVAVVFAVMLMVTLMFAGVAVDYSRVVSDETKAQRALDAAVLAAASNYQKEGDKSLAIKRANEMLNAQGVKQDTYAATFKFSDDEVVAEITSQTKTSIMKLFTIDEMKWQVVGAANYTSGSIIDYALAIDISSSMRNGGHMPALRAGLEEFSDAVFAGAKSGDVSVSLVPFANAVAFPATFSKWLSSTSVYPFVGCFYQEPGNAMASLSKAYIGNYDATPDMRMNSGLRYCPQSDTHVSFFAETQSDFDDRSGALESYQGTATSAGLSWAWRILDPDWQSEFGQSSKYPRAFNNENKKILILFTDGKPYVRPWIDEKISNSEKEEEREEALKEFEAVCAAIKADGRFHLFSIGYGEKLEQDAAVMLKNCVAGEGAYYYADEKNLASVFRAIAGVGHKIALTR